LTYNIHIEGSSFDRKTWRELNIEIPVSYLQMFYIPIEMRIEV